MDRVTSKQTKASVIATMRQLARSAGFRTRSQTHYTTRGDFLLSFHANYIDAATEEYAKGEVRLLVRLWVKTIESDQVLWRICQMTDELDKHSVDPLLGLDVVQSVRIAKRAFRIAAPDDVPLACQNIVDFASNNFASFLASIGNSLEGFYRYVVGLDPKLVWRDEVVFPIAYIQLGDYRAALFHLDNDTHDNRATQLVGFTGRNRGELAYRSKGRCFGDYLAEYCQAHLHESRPVTDIRQPS